MCHRMNPRKSVFFFLMKRVPFFLKCSPFKSQNVYCGLIWHGMLHFFLLSCFKSYPHAARCWTLTSILFLSIMFFSFLSVKSNTGCQKLFVSVNLAVNVTDSVIMRNSKRHFLAFGWGGLEEEVHFYPSWMSHICGPPAVWCGPGVSGCDWTPHRSFESRTRPLLFLFNCGQPALFTTISCLSPSSNQF